MWLQASVRCLGNWGKLLEIGKYDILKGTPLSMRPMLNNVSFHGIDVDRVMNHADSTEVQPAFSSLKHHAHMLPAILLWLGCIPAQIVPSIDLSQLHPSLQLVMAAAGQHLQHAAGSSARC